MEYRWGFAQYTTDVLGVKLLAGINILYTVFLVQGNSAIFKHNIGSNFAFTDYLIFTITFQF